MPINFEQSWRSTLLHDTAMDFDSLYDQAVRASKKGLELAYHYGAKHVSCAMPAWDQSSEGLVIPKMIIAGNYKPEREEPEDDRYVRVCAEQNVISNGLKETDQPIGYAVLRRAGNWGNDQMRGTHNSDFCLCDSCRVRCLDALGPDFIWITYEQYSDVPVCAMTTQQQIDHYDRELPRQVVAEGLKVQVAVAKALALRRTLHPFKKPTLPARIYRV
jgi:hypothetical protein